jgi:hypothetical protein
MTNMRIPFAYKPLAYALFGLVALGVSPAFAQTADAPAPIADAKDGKKIFTPDFFTTYAPITALDMVDRIPGFSLDLGNDRRGFGDNAGNVLIDGERPSTKSDSLSTILSRITASQVERIELTEQAGSSNDARGQAQIINVVRKAGNKVSGTYELAIETNESGATSPYGSTAVTLKRGRTTYDLSAAYFSQANNDAGPEVFRNGTGLLRETRNQVNANRFNESGLSAAIKTNFGDVKLNFNAKLNFDWFRQRRLTDILGPTNLLLGTEELKIRDADLRTKGEIGGDIEFPITTTLSTKIIYLYSQTKTTGSSSNLVQRGPTQSLSSTASRGEPSELIFRNQTNWKVSPAHAVQFGVEVAVNKLTASFSSSSSSNGAITQFPASDVKVKELRFEPFISDVWSINPALNLEMGIVAEKSRLTVVGGSGDKRDFLFWKPRAVATWTYDKATTVEFKAERQVAQLDFNDFVSSFDLGSNQANAGNSQLVPEKTWTFGTVVRHKFWDRGSIQLSASYVFVNDTQDLIPVIERNAAGIITSQFDGPGNIGASKRWNLEAEITLPFDRFTSGIGITGMELKWTGRYNGAEVTDPVTGLKRVRSNNPVSNQTFNFRHDISKVGISWGANVLLQSSNRQFFIDQINIFSSGAEVFAWVEYKKFSLGTLRFQVGNPTDVLLRRNRIFFQDTRASGIVTDTFDRQRKRDMRFLLSLNGKF